MIFHFLKLRLTGWKRRNREKRSLKLHPINVFNYKRDTLLATVEWFEENVSEKMKLIDQKTAMKFANENFQRLDFEL